MPEPKILPVAETVPFDNATNDMVAEDTQAAVEEARPDIEVGGVPLASEVKTINLGTGLNATVTGTREVTITADAAAALPCFVITRSACLIFKRDAGFVLRRTP